MLCLLKITTVSEETCAFTCILYLAEGNKQVSK